MSSGEKHVELQELIEDSFLCEPDDRNPQDYAMEDAERHSDFWDDQSIYNTFYKEHLKKQKCKKSLKRGNQYELLQRTTSQT